MSYTSVFCDVHTAINFSFIPFRAFASLSLSCHGIEGSAVEGGLE